MQDSKYIEQVLSDKRNCRSNNIGKFFSRQENRRCCEVIRFDGALYFASLGWRTRTGDNGFAGVRVVSVACFGLRAEIGYPGWQKGNDYEVVTDWFWQAYFNDNGMYAHHEIWHRTYPVQTSHREAHTI